MSLRLIFRRMLPRMLPLRLFSGLCFSAGLPSSALSLSVLGLTMGGRACSLAPALKLRSSRKFSRSTANLTSASSKSKSARRPSRPVAFPLPFVGPAGRMVTLLRLLCVLPSRLFTV